MSYKLPVLFYFSLFLAQFAAAQEHIAKIAPLGIFDPYYPKVQLGYERISENNIGLELELGRFLRNAINKSRTNKRGWHTSMEIRKYSRYRPFRFNFLNLNPLNIFRLGGVRSPMIDRLPSKNSALFRTFWGVELQYIQRYFTHNFGTDAATGLQTPVPINAKIQRLLFKLGTNRLFQTGNRLEYSISAGLSQNRTIHKQGTGTINRNGIVAFFENEGTEMTPYVGFNLRVGFTVHSKVSYEQYY